MAITQTGAIYKAFSFDNVSSRDFGVYITSEAVYNAPERDVEMISIPGRNGAFALDRSRFENIEVKYPAGIFADNETDFAQAVSDLRNYLCSKKGYFRLTDEYNPNEYRMAVYKSGLEVSPVQLKAGEFEIIFDCKPQRWLTSGESEVTVTSGGTITNPTLFESKPMLEVTGYGDVHIGDNEITLVNSIIGDIPFSGREYTFNSSATSGILSVTLTGIADKANPGDVIDVCLNAPVDQFISTQAMITGNIPPGAGTMGPATDPQSTYPNHLVVTETGLPSKSLRFEGTMSGGVTYYVTVSLDPFSFVYGTSETKSYSLAWEFLPPLGDDNIVFTTTLTAVYNGTDKITFTLSRAVTNDDYDIYSPSGNFKLITGDIIVHSTKSTLGTPTYVDCDLGEAYMISNGNYISLNSAVQLPAELPTLAAGENEITFDNTVTDLKIVPRWWKI